MADPRRTLFVPVVPTEHLNPHFRQLVDAPGYDPARTMLDEVYQDYDDTDGNFLEQFQTTGFHPRFFELYLFAYFARSGFKIDRTHPTPDFIVTRKGVSASVEATTVNPSQGEPATGGAMPSRLDQREFKHFLDQELPIRFGSPLFSKLQKKYWELEHCRNQPFILAIEAFFNDDSLTLSGGGLVQYLYGLRMSADWTSDGNLKIHSDAVESHMSGKKKVPSNFFGQPSTQYISAVVFTNSGTHAKFARMGYQQGIGIEHFDISRYGFSYNPEPDAKDPTYFSYSLAEPPLVESWGQGLVVNHNPNALYPLPRDFFPEAVQGYIEGGEYKSEHPDWHPIMSTTRILHFVRPDNRPPRSPRVCISAISKSDFQHFCRFTVDESTSIVTEDGWFSDETESFLGVVLRHKNDNDWGYVILARDEHFQFRAIETAASISARDIARGELQLAMAKLAVGGQRMFPQELSLKCSEGHCKPKILPPLTPSCGGSNYTLSPELPSESTAS